MALFQEKFVVFGTVFYRSLPPCYLSVGVSGVSGDIIFQVQQKPISLGHEVNLATGFLAA